MKHWRSAAKGTVRTIAVCSVERFVAENWEKWRVNPTLHCNSHFVCNLSTNTYCIGIRSLCDYLQMEIIFLKKKAFFTENEYPVRKIKRPLISHHPHYSIQNLARFHRSKRKSTSHFQAQNITKSRCAIHKTW